LRHVAKLTQAIKTRPRARFYLETDKSPYGDNAHHLQEIVGVAPPISIGSRPYTLGEVITDRPINITVGDFIDGISAVPTLIDEARLFTQDGTFLADYVPMLAAP